MRKALIAVAVATALFAVGAFAASFTVQSEDIASGADAVEACADRVDIEFSDITKPLDSASDWTVAEATATFYDESAVTAGVFEVTSDCGGFNARLALTIDTDVKEFGADVLVDGSVATFVLDPVQNVGQITNATVVVEGQFLLATIA